VNVHQFPRITGDHRLFDTRPEEMNPEFKNS
jgi:hypothetical protein